jgi:hypothetical protein
MQTETIAIQVAVALEEAPQLCRRLQARRCKPFRSALGLTAAYSYSLRFERALIRASMNRSARVIASLRSSTIDGGVGRFVGRDVGRSFGQKCGFCLHFQ